MTVRKKQYEHLRSGSDAWKYWDERRAGNFSKGEWEGIEGGIARSYGHCMTMGNRRSRKRVKCCWICHNVFQVPSIAWPITMPLRIIKLEIPVRLVQVAKMRSIPEFKFLRIQNELSLFFFCPGSHCGHRVKPARRGGRSEPA